MTGHDETPVDDYLDELLRRSQADPRSVRRILDEASEHLLTVAAELEQGGMSRVAAEREAVRRFGPVGTVTRGTRLPAFGVLVAETLRAALLLGGVGLVAVGISGGIAAVLNAVLGERFVGGPTVVGVGQSSIAESAQDAVVLRVLAGVIGLIALGVYLVCRRLSGPSRVLPAGLVDALGAAAFAAATVVLTGTSIDQAATFGANGVGFFLSGAVVALAGTVLYCARAARSLLSGVSRTPMSALHQ